MRMDGRLQSRLILFGMDARTISLSLKSQWIWEPFWYDCHLVAYWKKKLQSKEYTDFKEFDSDVMGWCK